MIHFLSHNVNEKSLQKIIIPELEIQNTFDITHSIKYNFKMITAELKKLALKKISENAPKLFFISALYVAITAVLGVLRFRLPGTTAAWEQFLLRLSAGELPSIGMFLSNFRAFGIAMAVVIIIAAPVINAGFMHYCLKINRDQETDYIDIFEGFTLFFKIILISVIVSILVLLWSLLLIIPGIAAAYKYRQVYYILIDAPEKDIMQCIRESELLMRGNKLDLFLLDVSFLGWIMLNWLVMLVTLVFSPVALPLVSVFLTPYQGLARATFYERMVQAAVI